MRAFTFIHVHSSLVFEAVDNGIRTRGLTELTCVSPLQHGLDRSFELLSYYYRLDTYIKLALILWTD